MIDKEVSVYRSFIPMFGARRAICWSLVHLGSHFARSPQLGRSRMTRHRARSFQLESLEGKQLLSTLHPAHHARSKPAPLVLNGTLKELEGQNVSGYSGELKSLGQVVANVNPQTDSRSAQQLSSPAQRVASRSVITLIS